jgi:hypothetical protein
MSTHIINLKFPLKLVSPIIIKLIFIFHFIQTFKLIIKI